MKAEKKDKKKKGRKKSAAAEMPLPPEQQAPGAPPQDGMGRALAAVGGKWKMPILWALRGGAPLRYSEVKRLVPGITDVMLSQSLKALVEDGLVSRQELDGVPLRVLYRMTESGAAALPALELLAAWGQTL